MYFMPRITLRSVNDVTEGSTQEAHMCAFACLVWVPDSMLTGNDVCFLGATF